MVKEAHAAGRILGRGLAASGGAAVGMVVFTHEEAEECKTKQEACILVKSETTTDDIRTLKVNNIKLNLNRAFILWSSLSK